jgi:hypothetical protein
MELLAEVGVIRDDVPTHDLAYAFRTIIIGFFLVDPFLKDVQPSARDPAVERSHAGRHAEGEVVSGRI